MSASCNIPGEQSSRREATFLLFQYCKDKVAIYLRGYIILMKAVLYVFGYKCNGLICMAFSNLIHHTRLCTRHDMLTSKVLV